MIMVLGPHKKKSEARADVEADKAKRDRRAGGRPGGRAAEAERRPQPGSRQRGRTAVGAPDGRRAVRRGPTCGTQTLRRRAWTPALTRRGPADAVTCAQMRHGTIERKEHTAMPKMKTHCGAKKRFRVTGSGQADAPARPARSHLETKYKRQHAWPTRRVAPATPRSQAAARL